jgi:hypothetical protein
VGFLILILEDVFEWLASIGQVACASVGQFFGRVEVEGSGATWLGLGCLYLRRRSVQIEKLVDLFECERIETVEATELRDNLMEPWIIP